MTVNVKSFFEESSSTLCHIVWCSNTKHAAIVDSVLDFDEKSAKTTTKFAEKILFFVKNKNLNIKYHIETHIHADHLSAAPFLKRKLGGKIVTGADVPKVQEIFKPIFNLEEKFKTTGKQFDKLFNDGEEFKLGEVNCKSFSTPGHTSSCYTWLIGDALFVGDTLFAPDHGTARCDFPGGSANILYSSIQKLYRLPSDTRVFLCHDYQPGGRELVIETTIGEQKRNNVMINSKTTKKEFVDNRKNKDSKLSMPKLIFPSVQVNIRAGELPPEEKNGIKYLKIPLNQFNN